MKRPESRSHIILSVLHRVLILMLKLREKDSLSNINKHYVAKDYYECHLYVSLQRIQLLSSDAE